MSGFRGVLPASRPQLGRVAVIDFETTGMSPARGDRATEIAIVMLEEGRIVGQFQQLMHTGVPIPFFITGLTGITQRMVEEAPAAADVMWDAMTFVGDTPLVAHNAAFDRQFWEHECHLAGMDAQTARIPFACTVRLARRIFPDAPSYKLGQLARHLKLPTAGRAHRALADAQVTAALWVRLQHELHVRWGVLRPDHALLADLQYCQRAALPRWLARHARTATPPSLHRSSA